MEIKPLLVVTGETVMPPVLHLRESIAILPLVPQVWAGRQEEIQIISPRVPPDWGVLETVRQTARLLDQPLPEPLDSRREEFARLYFSAAAQVNAMLLALEELHHEVGVRGIVVHNDVEPLTRAACVWGNRNGVPTIHVPHAHYFDVWRDDIGWDVHDVVTARWLCAINERQADWYRRRGARNITVTGNPVWDRWAGWRAGKRRVRTLLGLDPERPVVTYMTSWPQDTSLLGTGSLDYMLGTFAQFCQAVKGLGWQLLLLHHHHSSDELANHYIQIARENGVMGVTTREHFRECLTAADVVAAFGPSNALIEAAVLGRGVLCVGAEVPPLPSAPPEANAIAVALTAQQEPPQAVRDLAPYIGEATRRVAKVIADAVQIGTDDAGAGETAPLRGTQDPAGENRS